jgi:TonB-dependent receptor
MLMMLVASFLAASHGFAQSPSGEGGVIEGAVYNITSGLPLGRAKVVVKDSGRETLTDDQGRFVFSEIPKGEYQLRVSYLGFEPQDATVTVEDGKSTARDFQLARAGASPAGQTARGDSEVVLLEQFTVVADQAMTAQALAMNEQRHAGNIKNVVAFEELGEQGQENIGNYVRFLPGVVIMDDGENAGSVAFGGFPDSMSNVMLDGGAMASTGAGAESSRTLSLQDMPMVGIERIEVSKVPLPDMPASGLGGSMNVITKSLLGIKKAAFTYQMYMNFNNRDGFTFDGGPHQATAPATPKYMQPSFNASLVFPAGRRLAFSMGVSRTWSRRTTDDTPTEAANWNLLTENAAGTRDIALMEALWTQQANIGMTENIQAGMEVRLSAKDTLAIGVQRRDTSNKTTDYGFTARFGSSGFTGDASYVQSGTAGARRLDLSSKNNYELSTETTHTTLHYRHTGSRWRMGVQATYSAAKRLRDGMDNGYFSIVTVQTPNYNVRGEGINEGVSILPNSYVITTGAGAAETPVDMNPYDAGDYNLTTVGEEYGVYKTDLYSGRADVEYIAGSRLSIKAGGVWSRQEKDDRRLVNNYTFRADARGAKVSAYDLIDDSIDVRINGTPVRWISPVKTYELFREEQGMFELNDTAPRNTALNSKRMVEDISAAYLRLDLRLSNRLNIIGGVRYEKTRLDGWSMKEDRFAIYQRDANGELIRDVNGTLVQKTNASGQALTSIEKNRLIHQERAHHEGQGNDGLYPSVNANYEITENLVARAAYARTIGRPNISYVVAGITLPVSTSLDPDDERLITVGNPGLKPWTADSFHLSLDSYNVKGGFGSIGVYRKNVRNFFEQRIMLPTEETLRYYNIPETDREFLLSSNYLLRRWENAGDGYLTGLEFSYRQDVLFLPAWLQKLQVWANYTHLKVGGSNTEHFTGFTPDVFSCGINLIRPRYAIRLTCAYQAETRRSHDYTVSTSSVDRYPIDTYTFQGAYTKYGVTAEYALSRELILFANWDNVFAEDRYYYRRASDTPDWATRSQRRVIPSTIMVGVKGRF